MLLALSGSFLIAAPDPAQAVEDSLPEQALRCVCLARLLCRCGLRTVIFFAAQHTDQGPKKSRQCWCGSLPGATAQPRSLPHSRAFVLVASHSRAATLAPLAGGSQKNQQEQPIRTQAPASAQGVFHPLRPLDHFWPRGSHTRPAHNPAFPSPKNVPDLRDFVTLRTLFSFIRKKTLPPENVPYDHSSLKKVVPVIFLRPSKVAQVAIVMASRDRRQMMSCLGRIMDLILGLGCMIVE